MTLAAQIVVNLQTIVSRKVSPLDSAVVTVGSIHGGTKHNIIPNEVKLQLTVRSYKPEVRQLLLDSIRDVAQNTARAQGWPEDLLPIVEIQRGGRHTLDLQRSGAHRARGRGSSYRVG